MPRPALRLALLASALAIVAGCTEAPACIARNEQAKIEQMESVIADFPNGTALGGKATLSAMPHTLTKIRMPDRRARLCHITNDQARMFKPGEVVRGPWGVLD